MPDPLILVDPVQQTNFTARASSNPTDPLPPGLIDGEFGHLRAALLTAVQVLRGITSPDGLKLGQVVGLDQLTPAALAELTQAVEDAVAADTTAAQTAATSATNSAGTATTKAADATAAAASAVAARDTILNAQTGTLAQIATAQAAVNATKAAVDTAAGQVAADKADAEGAVAELEGLTRLAGAWAEHMPSTIPPDVLAAMGVTGDHWSARWWANQAAIIVASIQDLAEDAIEAVSLFRKLYLGPHPSDPDTDNDGHALQVGALYWNMVDLELRVWSGTIWAPATGAGAGAVTAATNVGGGASAFKELVTGVLSFRTIVATGGLGVNQAANEIQLTIDAVAWGKLTGKPTTIAGYGIADAYTKAEIDAGQASQDAAIAARATVASVSASQAAQDAEIALRAHSTDLDAEIAARTTADSGLQAQINNRVSQSSATGGANIPAGTTAQRDAAPSVGRFRYNTTLSLWEGWDGALWVALGADLSAYARLSGANAFDTRPTFAGKTPFDSGNFDPAVFYTKTETDAALGAKLNKAGGTDRLTFGAVSGTWAGPIWRVPVQLNNGSAIHWKNGALSGQAGFYDGTFYVSTGPEAIDGTGAPTSLFFVGPSGAAVLNSTVITAANFGGFFSMRRVPYGQSALTSPNYWTNGNYPGHGNGTFMSAILMPGDHTHYGYYYALQFYWNGTWYTISG